MTKLRKILAEEGLTKTSSKESMEVGDRVQLKGSRVGWVEGTVVEVTHNYRARRFPWVVHFVTDTGQDFKGKRQSNRYDDPQNKRMVKYLGKSRASPKKLQESRDRDQGRSQKKQERADEGYKSLDSWRLNPGDVIIYEYNNGRKQEVVSDVNYRTGKVGIEKFTPAQKKMYLQKLKETNDSFEALNYISESMGGPTVGRRKKRTVRWLPAQGILKVVTRA